MTVKESHEILIAEESDKMIEQDKIIKTAKISTENNGIVFLHLGQKDRPVIICLFFGNRYMQTFAKLPKQIPIKKTKRLKLVEVVQLLREITNVEMDLRFEAAAANELYENTKNDVGFKVPKIYWNQTSKKVLCLEKVDGISIREVENLKSLNIDIKKLAKNIIQHFLRHAVRDGFFHADMHQGNLFVTKNSNIVPVDFGIMGRLDKNNRKYLAEILYGFIKRDYKKVAEVHFLAGLVSKNISKDDSHKLYVP